jgi:ATP-dependent RNA circularization protein (DNA/RNA ligase family)
MERITKYPRTAHLKGSKMQRGDGDLNKIDFSLIVGKNIVIEEKVDGANTGISFSASGELLLQSRGHYLTGGYSERHYDLFKKWAYNAVNELFEVLGDRYIMYGEWLYAKHKIYYDSLPNYFLEFDIYDKKEGVFLSTERRKELLKNSTVISVPVLGEGVYKNKEEEL